MLSFPVLVEHVVYLLNVETVEAALLYVAQQQLLVQPLLQLELLLLHQLELLLLHPQPGQPIVRLLVHIALPLRVFPVVITHRDGIVIVLDL